MPRIRAVYFDIGETILDRTREYAAWAQMLGVPAHTFSSVFGAVIAQGGTVRDVVARFRPDESFESLRVRIAVPPLAEPDLYPDARAGLAKLRSLGLHVGVAGNQPDGIGDELRALDLPVDVVATSAEWGVEKPAPEFFERVVRASGVEAADVAYVGDQIDKDMRPALRAGLQAVRIRRGPWGMLVHDAAIEAQCRAVIDSIDELPTVLAEPT